MMQFVYRIVCTPWGKGYACFCLNKTGFNTYQVSASFCNPLDKFNKSIARDLAKSHPSVTIMNSTGSMVDVVKSASKRLDNIPNWFDMTLTHSLMDDRHNNARLVDRLPQEAFRKLFYMISSIPEMPIRFHK
jgi:hypothetical protein